MEVLGLDKVKELLRLANPKARPDEICLYAEAYVEYQQASGHIAEHGPIITHPRSGVPMDNPYIKVRAAAIDRMTKLMRSRNLHNVEELWPCP